MSEIMDIEMLSDKYHVRKLDEKDLEQIYELSCGNVLFYEYHPPFVTRESIIEDMQALPPGKCCEDKFYIGFYDDGHLVAVMDLIRNFPEKGIAFIGLFMVDSKYQGKGIGSAIIQECISSLTGWGYQAVRLGVDIGNPQSMAFWSKNGFVAISKDNYILMELRLTK